MVRIFGRVAALLSISVLLLLGYPSSAGEILSGPFGDYQCVQPRGEASRPPFDPPRIISPEGIPVQVDPPVLQDPLCPPGLVPAPTWIDPSATKGNPLAPPDGLGAGDGNQGTDSPGSPECAGISHFGACYYYANASYRRNADGGGMTFTIERPFYDGSGGTGHSLAEIAVQGGPGDGNIVEVGWNVSTNQYGNANPHLFVFHWIGWTPTCYDACGWVQQSPTYFPGMDLSALIGRKSYSGWVFWNRNWWAWFDNQWLGYFPGSEWTQEYRQNGLTQWFGEVATHNGIPPNTEMGNGRFPSDPAAAKMETLCDVNASDWVCWYRDLQTIGATNPSYYDILRTAFGATRYGGPGR